MSDSLFYIYLEDSDMKPLLRGGLSALLLTTTMGVMPSFTPTVLAQTAVAPMVFNFTAPIITNSGVRGSTHFIRIAVIGMSLKDLMIEVPSQMTGYDGIKVTDQFGKVISAKTEFDKERVSIAFAQPVSPGGYLEVSFTGARMTSPGGETLLYGVTAERLGTKGEIPIGTARVEVPSYN
jgi:hypothetical protein